MVENSRDRTGISRRSLLAGAAVGGAGLAATLSDPSAALAAASGGNADRREPLAVEREPGVGIVYVLEVPGMGPFGFFKACDGLASETEVVEFRDGSDPNIIRKIPGVTRYHDIDLSRPLTADLSLTAWRRLVEDGRIDEARKDSSLVMSDAAGNPVARYNLENAWPSKIAIGDLSTDSNEVVMETITITCEFVQRVRP